MIDTATIERYMRDANPIPDVDDLDPDEFGRFVAAADTRRAAIMQVPAQHESTEPHPTTPQPSPSRRAWAFAAAFILILASIGIAALVLRSDETPVTDEPQTPPDIEQLSWTRVADHEAVFTPADYASINDVKPGGPGLVAVGGVLDSRYEEEAWIGIGMPGVWTSSDGYEWSVVLLEDQIEDEAQGWKVDTDEIRSVTATESTLYAVGYGSYEYPGTEEEEGGAWGTTGMVWTSPDGTNWTAVPDLAVFADAELSDIVEGGPGLVAVGQTRGPGPPPDGAPAVWVSSDGATWTRTEVETAVAGRIGGVTVGGPGLVAVGAAGEDAAVWTSRDGTVWTRVAHDETVFGGPGYQTMSGVTVGGPGLVAVGGDRGRAAVWTSPDGSHWTRIPHDEEVFGGFVHADWGPDFDPPMKDVIATSSGLVAVGRQIVGVEPGSRAPDETVGDPLDQATVWTSPDGNTWSRIPYPEAGTTMNSVAEGGPGLIAVGSHHSRHEGSAAVWVARP